MIISCTSDCTVLISSPDLWGRVCVNDWIWKSEWLKSSVYLWIISISNKLLEFYCVKNNGGLVREILKETWINIKFNVFVIT